MARGTASKLEKVLVAACLWAHDPEQLFQCLDDTEARKYPRARALLIRAGRAIETTNDTLLRSVKRALVLEGKEDGPPIPPDLEPLVSRTERRSGALGPELVEEEAAMLAAIFAAPDDDGPRHVYADWLLARGDPHGEFIALQLRPNVAKTKSAQGKLLAVYRDIWLFDVARHLTSVVFRRGFACRARYVGKLWRDTFEADAYATIEELEIEYAGHLRDFRRPYFRALRKLARVDASDLEALAKQDDPLLLEHVGLRYCGLLDTDTAKVRAAIERGALAKLRRADAFDEVTEEKAFPVLLGAKLPCLTELGVLGAPADLQRWERFRERHGLTALYLGLGATWRYSVESPVEVALRADGITLTYVSRDGATADSLSAWVDAILALKKRPPVEVVCNAKLSPALEEKLFSQLGARC
jgi:uncharacterized protein (TIGR02996 family)